MTETAAIPQWHVVGDWFDVCKCSIPCPCTYAQPPTFGDCDGVLAWRIREGRYGDVSLDGLNVLMLGSFVGNVWGEHSDSYAAVFLDERADDSQRGALGKIFGGEAGGWPARLVEMLAPEIRGLEFSPITISVDDDLAGWRAELPGRIVARGEALTGPTTPEGARVRTINPPGAETGPGQIVTWGRALADQVDAYGFTWDWEGRSSKHIPFDWSGPG
ncbi:DUF1326 domain-containing protein [Actinomadura formosensis]|uniref:DUF1326 domain-containing protein n=1 Tax=Actinomadura formosensis TaxID=60706 RepID=UPI00082FF4F4|nr:DUF1326 domain-containing protein [Actinomadura formosensis]